MEIGEYLSQAIDLTVGYARGGERIRGTMGILQAALDPISELLELDGDLGPEVVAAATILTEAHAALGRAATFLTARYEEQMGRLHAARVTGAGE